MEILDELLDSLIKMDESLERQDINSTLKFVHESISKIKNYKETKVCQE